MDIVITYVDGNDVEWKKDYEKYADEPVMQKRFRDWGTLKYLLRGIECKMPFVRNVYLVVSHSTQVPDWVNQDVLKVVLHSDIIPSEFLPVFNSTAIEMFLHKIDGLDEQYIYFNDDLFPVGDFHPDDFFPGGKITTGFRKHILASGMYKKQCRNSDHMARKALGMKPGLCFIRPQHVCSPMLKSQCAALYDKMEKEILATVTRLRTDYNLNQYVFLDYMYYNGNVVPGKISNRHFSVAVAGADRIAQFIRKPDRKLCCINDVHLSEEKFSRMRDIIIRAFEDVFPAKSRFEK